MREYHTTIIIHRPIADVWQALVDFPNYKNWNPLVRDITGDIREGGQIITDIVPLNKAYAFTAACVAVLTDRLIAGVNHTGFVTPSIFGKELIEGMDKVKITVVE